MSIESNKNVCGLLEKHGNSHEQLFTFACQSLTANRKLLRANPPLTSVTGDHHGVQCVNRNAGWTK
uniref:SFRICE_037995 n=1 Tax=Spodoptera frugiperda TaxID=7108 RepID=A0A2H1VIR3_SPOFR